MGSEAAIAYQLMSGLAGGVSTMRTPKAQPILPNASVYAGAQALQQSAIDTEVQAQQQQADLAVQEGQLELERQGYEGNFVTQQIAQQYNDSGVSGQTPMLMINQARIAKQNEIKAYGLQQTAISKLLDQKAFITGSTVRAQLAAGNADFITKLAAAQMSGDAQDTKFRSTAFSDFSGVLGKAIGLDWGKFSKGTFGNKGTKTYGTTGSVAPGSTSTYGNP